MTCLIDDVKHNPEKLAEDGQAFIDGFRTKLKKVVDEVFGEAYVNILPYIETDAWTNYREALRIDLAHEYKFATFKEPWAKNLRRAIFVENREELSQLISKDLLEVVKKLEDRVREFEMFRYT